MEIKYRRINFLTLLILGIFIAIVSIAAYYFTLQIVHGEMRLKNVKLAALVTSPAKIIRPINTRIGILISDDSQNIPGTAFNNNFIKGWQSFFTSEKISYDTLHGKDLAANKIKYDILILPFNSTISELEISRISEFLNSGGGLIACGECGFRDEKGEIGQPTFLNRILGITKINKIDESIKSYVPLTLKTSSPLTLDIPMGAQLGLNTDDGCIRAKIIENRTIQDGYFYDSEVDKGIPLSEIENSTGLCHGTYGKGRFVWLGFNISSFTGDEFTQKTYHKVLRNALLWLAKKPLASIKTWPGDYRTAAVISGDIEYEFSNVGNVIEVLEKNKIQGSFFILSDLAELNVDWVRKMAENGEIGLHGDEHTDFKDQNYEIQLERLRKAKQVLEQISGQKIIGFRPPFGNYDENTVRALTKIGINYLVLGMEGGTDIEPHFIRYLDDFMIMPKPNQDDYDLFNRDSMTEPDEIFAELKDEFDAINDLGGLFVFTYHSQILAVDTNCQVITDLIDYMKSKNVWIATWKAIADWYRKKQNLTIALEEENNKYSIITLSNQGTRAIEDFKVQIFPPDIASVPQIKSDFKEDLECSFDKESGSYYISINKINPKTSRRIIISFGS
jgi:peptidoglycan/xylan/chitin deacetylase (PgdA/CDA1 family)